MTLNFLHNLWTLKPLFATVFAFIIPISLAIHYSPDFESESKCAYVIVVMALLWLTEAIPIPVTALMPVFLFPLLGVVKASVISGVYVKDATMLFLGGLIIAGALEESGLHIRISLYVMKIVGAQPMLLMAGLLATTWFLSMWISNTAATSMMIPIIEAVINNIEEAEEEYEDAEAHRHADDSSVSKVSSLESSDNSEKRLLREASHEKSSEEGISNHAHHNAGQVRTHPLTPELRRLAKAFALSVAYGANIGGTATLTGSPPNLVFKQQADKLYEFYTGSESDISFAKWMGFAFPLSLLTAVLGWLWLVLVFIRCGCCKKIDSEHKRAINASIQHHFKELGKLSFCEIQVLVVFIFLVFLWLFRAPPNIDGWGTAATLKKGYVSDSTPCILLSVLLFLLPAEVPKVFKLAKGEKPSYKPILHWKSVTEKLPWGVIVLLGGGFAIAQASEDSGLSLWVGNELKVFANMDMWVMNLVICLIVAGVTNVTSNTASATLLMPILAQLALQTEIHPIYLMMSVSVACSFAFMLPVATPPNAIVFSTGYLTIPDMVLAGLPINIVAVFCLTLAINTWGMSMFELDVFPEVFKTNITV
ncbi:Na(+)/citrate cotransporter-like [Mercenaria mercenaria]|uniref:Na(+)/citrate cotransporter-like n=1 Tax=Mercenaria mercenaria TaxID=6596 RepID=UPI00234F0459|nr:Na(+)/citrate cotransporter-like [Mercenaria mercenaria]